MPRIWTVCAGAVLPIVGLLAQITKTPISATPPNEGATMFKAYCASCHGPEGKGGGPASKALKVPVGDLTKLAKYNDGEFPTFHVMAVLTQASGAHGSSEMPIWSDVFRGAGQDTLIIQERVYNLTRYLEGIQDPPSVPKQKTAKAPEPPTVSSISPGSGGAMFRAYCASCHGSDGRGQGPAAWTLKTAPPDLTVLAQNNGGKYPESRVGSVLRQGKDTPIHGTPEMPVWGNVFRTTGDSAAVTQIRIYNLMRYIEGLQRR